MRLLFLSNLYPPVVLGGYELACANVAKAMADRGHDVHVLTSWSHLPRIDDQSVSVDRGLDLHFYIPYASGNATVRDRDAHSAFCSSYVNTHRLLEAIRSFRPDVVYVWNVVGIGGMALLDLLNVAQVPWVLHLMDRTPTELINHSNSRVRGLFNAQGPDLYADAGIISVSQHLLDEIEGTSGIVFPQGVDLIPCWANAADDAPHEPFLRNGVARFVAAGWVGEHKGMDQIIEASALLKARGVSFSVGVYGEGEVPKYLDRAKTLQVDDCVKFFGHRRQQELIKIYSQYDACLFPSWEREPFGFAPLEAASRGTPCIMTRSCGAAERMVDDVHCLKIDRTAQDLADTMARVAAGEVDLARMGRAARHLVSSDLSFHHCLDQIETVLERHGKPWNWASMDDNTLPLLAFVKHNLSVAIGFG